MTKYLCILLFSLSAFASEPRMMLAEVSTLTSDKSKTFTLTFGSQLFKDGFLSLGGTKVTYLDDDSDEEDSSTGGFVSYTHDLNRYLSVGMNAERFVESEYITTRDTSLSVDFKLHPLWKSYYRSVLTLGGGNKYYYYFQELENSSRNLDKDFLETYTFIAYSQDITRYFNLGVQYTSYFYNEQPEDYIDRFPVLMSFFPNFESLLYSFADETKSIWLKTYYKKFTLYLGNSINTVLYTQKEEITKTIKLTYNFSSCDLSLKQVNSDFEEEKSFASGLEFTYYF